MSTLYTEQSKNVEKTWLLMSMFLVVVIFFNSFNIAKAQEKSFVQDDYASVVESINSFDAQIKVNVDNSIDVTEILTYASGGLDKHGIYRDIYPFSSEGRKMSIENVSITDENNNPYKYSTLKNGKDIRFKIGDPDITFNGKKIYVIKYHATRAIAHLENVDELYWNVTGNEWAMPIDKVQVMVTLPSGILVSQSSCYFGIKGSKSLCPVVARANQAEGYSKAVLGAGEGFTIAVGFPKGTMTPYKDGEGMPTVFDSYYPWIIAGILPLLTLILSLLYWYKNGQDPKGTGVIVAQYDVLDGLTPMEVVCIVKEQMSNESLSAEIVYLATKGYIKITQISDSNVFGLFKSTDYKLTKLKDYSDLPNDFDKALLSAFFGVGGRDEVNLSSLKYVFYKDAKNVMQLALSALLSKGYYKNLGRIQTSMPVVLRFILSVFLGIFASIFLGSIFLGTDNQIPIMASVFLSIIIFSIVSYFNPAKTEKGVAAREYLLGLKEYLQIAEKDRLQFHNAPEKKPEIFEALLPYAMVLGVTDIWAKEFEGIYVNPPSWYSGYNSGNFSAVAFTHNLSSFGSFASSTMSSTPGGSGGGGSSGGGGGGGGGGSW